MDTLSRADRGTFLVTTRRGSAYRLAMTDESVKMVRVPHPTAHEIPLLQKRKKPFVVLRFGELHLGLPGIFDLEPIPEADAGGNVLITSQVLTIERIADAS